jgi:hypothetical protein
MLVTLLWAMAVSFAPTAEAARCAADSRSGAVVITVK